MSDIEQKAREALFKLVNRDNDWTATTRSLRAALDELAALTESRDRFSEDIAVLQTAVDILKADLAGARRERDPALGETAVFVELAELRFKERDDARRERDEAWAGRAFTEDLLRGADERAAEAESRHDEWRSKYEALEIERATCCAKMQRERDEARRTLCEIETDADPAGTKAELIQLRDERSAAAVALLETVAERDEVVWLLHDTTKSVEAYDAERKPEVEWDEYDAMMVPIWRRVFAFLSEFPERPGISSNGLTQAGGAPSVLSGGLSEPAKESEPRCSGCGGSLASVRLCNDCGERP